MKCQKCGTEHNSNFCPDCGAPATQQQLINNFKPAESSNYTYSNLGNNQQPKKSKKKAPVALIVVISIFVFAALMGIIFGEDSSSTTTDTNSTNSSYSEPEITYIEISAEKLWIAYEENEIAAEEKYNGEYVRVTGVVADINSEDFLTSNNILLNVESSLFGCVQCNFNSKNAEALTNVQKGQRVTVTGTCGGLSLYNVMINGCELQ